MEDFQVTLPSNSSMKMYPKNKPQLYKTELVKPLILEGPWEVALIDIQYPYKWRSLKEISYITFIHYLSDVQIAQIDPEKEKDKELITEEPLQIIEDDGTILDYGRARVVQTQHYDIKVRITPGFYPSIQAILNKIKFFYERSNKSFSSDEIILEANYDEISDRIKFDCKNKKWLKEFEIEHDSELARVLGITRNKEQNDDIIVESIPFRSNYCTFLDRITSVYIYSDIVQHQIVGDSLAQLLGVAPVKGNLNEQYYWAFNPILYRPICKTFIKDIEIQLNASDGGLLPILQGNTIVRLHFRKVRHGI